MIREVKHKLMLDRPATYQIKVPGQLDESWSDWDRGMTVTVEGEDAGLAGHHPDRCRRPGRFTGSYLSTLFSWLAINLGKMGRVRLKPTIARDLFDECIER